MKLTYLILLSFLIIILGCDKPVKKENHDNHHHRKGSHGGEVIGAGKLHLEFVQDKKLGKISLYFLGSDAKAAQTLSTTPVINVKAESGPIQIKTMQIGEDSSSYEASKDIFKKNLKGRIAVNFEGRRLNFDIPEEHDHNHNDDHEHGHDDHEH